MSNSNNEVANDFNDEANANSASLGQMSQTIVVKSSSSSILNTPVTKKREFKYDSKAMQQKGVKQ